jgi:uncharacterized protein (UPF0335 family)
MSKKIGKFRNKTLSIICLSLLLYGDQRSISQESGEVDRIERLEKELETVKQELSNVKSEISSIKREGTKGKNTITPTKAKSSKSVADKSDSIEPNTKSLRKYDIKSKGNENSKLRG